MSIFFINQDYNLRLNNKRKIRQWISEVVSSYQKKVGIISYQFCSDEYVHKVNVQFLNHDTYTDIITFDYVEGNMISGDIVISVDRVKDNAKLFGTGYNRELLRVIIHGVLHLLGFKDKTDEDAAMMRTKENEALDLWNSMF